MLDARANPDGEKLHFPSPGDGAGAVMFQNDSEDVDGCPRACPVTSPFTQHDKPGDQHHTGLRKMKIEGCNVFVLVS